MICNGCFWMMAFSWHALSVCTLSFLSDLYMIRVLLAYVFNMASMVDVMALY